MVLGGLRAARWAVQHWAVLSLPGRTGVFLPSFTLQSVTKG